MGKGKRAFLLAASSSSKQENLKLLAGEDCFSISNFYLHYDIRIINLDYSAKTDRNKHNYMI